MLAERNVSINSAYKHLQIISQDKEKRMKYEAREKAIRDYNAGIYDAEQRGLQQGLRQGLEQGKEKGLQQGAAQEKINIARKLLRRGQSVEDVIEDTELTWEQVNFLKEELI